MAINDNVVELRKGESPAILFDKFLGLGVDRVVVLGVNGEGAAYVGHAGSLSMADMSFLTLFLLNRTLKMVDRV